MFFAIYTSILKLYIFFTYYTYRCINELQKHSLISPTSKGDKILLHFINQSGVKITTSVTEGASLLEVVINKNLDISGFGACEGTLACSTCHLIFDENVYKNLEPIADEELDMLDLAYGLTKTSRLGCQVCVQKWMDGMTVRVPRDVKDLRNVKESAENQ
uniref:Ferredoxin 1b n=1 Tax=Scleropages formosus TaxID=113540 RepID=A0A8D0CNC7_SCLFO